MGALSVYAYFQLDNLIVAGNQRRLQQDSKALGMSIVQELNWRAHALQREATRAGSGGFSSIPAPDGFRSLMRGVDPAALSSEQSHHLDLGRVVLKLTGGEVAGMYFRSGPTGPLFFGRLDEKNFWSNDESPEHYCVLTADLKLHFCTPGLHPPALSAWPQNLTDQNSGFFTWRSGDLTMQGGYWLARMQPAYGYPGLVVMVAESSESLQRSVRQFRQVFFASVLLACSLALWLALNQIRRQLRPLERLSEGTRALAEGDFALRVSESGDDEFGSLAQSFNRMSETLQRKFHLLNLLAELDRAILSASEMEYIVRAVLLHIRETLPCDFVGIMRLNEQGGGSLLAACPGDDQVAAQVWDCPDAGRFMPADPNLTWYSLDLGEDHPAFPTHIARQHFEQLLVFPVRVNERVDRLLILAYVHPPEALKEIVDAGCNLTDRLAVAASNIAWEEQLYHQGHYDALTDLPNRVMLRDRVEQALLRAEREKTSVAVLMIDFDNFKQINDSMGHSAGDAFLIECAQRLKACMRQSDTTARLGGDEFVVLVPDLPRGDELPLLDMLARKLNLALAESMNINGRLVTTPASIGIALSLGNTAGFEDMLKMADTAMYESKRQQPGSYRFYSGEMNAEVRARFELTQDLREAIGKDELLLYYQPKVSALTRRIVSAEALVRWNSPKRGLVPPGLFVALLDQMGLSSWLGEWVIEQACAQMAEWDRLGLPPIPVSVNISPAQFQEGNLIHEVESALSQYRLAPARLELEILEATAASDAPETHATLTRLREMGISIALDDFGTGYSSLVYLTQLPANVLKLDRAFIRTLSSDPRQKVIVERIVALALALEYCVIAEGVEEELQLTQLAEMGCNQIQGFLISRPIPPAEFAELLRAG